MTRCSRALMMCSSLAAVAAMGLPAAAQQRAGGDGRAHDANQQVGSGGTNRVEGQVDYSSRNDLMTGNVSGGRGFRGGVDYTAPGEFRGNLGSDQLFDFRAGSLQSSPSITDAQRQRSVLGGVGGVGSISVYRGFYSGGGGAAGQYGAGGRAIAVDGGSRGIFDAASLRGDAGLSGLRGDSFGGLSGDTLGTAQREDGGTTVFSASPLLGVRQTDLPGARDAYGGALPDLPRIRPRGDDEADADQTTSPGLNLGLSGASRIEGRRIGQMAGSIATVPSEEIVPGTPPGLVIGQQLQSLSISDMAGETLDQRVERLESMIRRQTDPNVRRPGAQVYQDLMKQLRERHEQADDARADQTRMEEMDGDDPLDAGLEDIDEQKVSEAERIAAEAMERAYAVYGRPGETRTDDHPDADPGAARETDPDADPAADAVPESVARLLDQLRTDLPRVESLAADAEDRANRLMKQAEQKLAAGDYFDAEALYRQARNNTPDNPMTLVGLVHAQMAGGMLRSAAFNLRQLFEKHPEMINIRYEAAVLPPKQRLQWLQDELQRMIDEKERAGEPGLLMAYLGHQTQSRQLIRYGLAVGESHNPRDPLFKVLREVWIDSDAPNPRPEAK